MPDTSAIGTVQDMTVAELIREGYCTPGCTSGVTDHARCGCQLCEGRFHGAAGQTRIPGTAALRKPRPPTQAGPDLLDLIEEEVAAVTAGGPRPGMLRR